MAMDINKLSAGHASQLASSESKKADSTNQQVRSQQQAQQLQQQTPVAKDSVSLTQQAQTLGQMQKTLSSTPSFNQERVASIKKAIADGEYKVNPEKLAQKLQEFESELGNLTS